MNQSIQFQERESWDAQQQAICFIALVNGLQVTCAIHHAEMIRRFGEHSGEASLAVFRRHRWDLEEEAERLILQGCDDAQGWYWLS